MSKIHINPVLHFQNNNSDYILNSINNHIFKVSPELASWLKKEVGTEPPDDILAIEYLKKSFVISDDMNSGLNDIYDILNQSNIFKPTSVCLLICQDCNLRCSYCYADGGRYNNRGFMSFEVAAKAIDLIVENARAKNRIPSISFFGGEPLLNYKLMKQIVAYVKEKGYNVAYGMTTNGTLINNDIEQFIVDNNISTQISIDGDERSQNLNRYYANKRGGYKDVISATADLREQGLLGARATITKDSPTYDSQILHLLSLGFVKVEWGYAIETLTYSGLNDMLNSFQILCDEFYKLVKQEKFQIAKRFGNIIRYLQRIHTASIRDRTCQSGQSLLAVDIEGNMYPCHRFISCEEYKLGSVFDDNIHQINTHKFYKEFGIRNHEKCLSCVARNFCCGGCMHMNYDFTSKTTESPEIVCTQAIEELKIIAKLYTALSKEQLDMLLQSKKEHVMNN